MSELRIIAMRVEQGVRATRLHHLTHSDGVRQRVIGKNVWMGC